MKSLNRMWLLLAALVLGNAVIVAAHAQDREARLREALASEDRAEQHKERDRNDHPLEVLEFLGVDDGMTALDVISGGGYWTGVLSPAVGPSGKVYRHNPAFIVDRGGADFLAEERALVERLGNVEPVHGDLEDANLEGEVDVAITSNNFHDMFNRGGEEGGVAFLSAIYAALKPGGALGLIDHEGLPSGDNAELHRIDPDAVRRTLEAAGFVIEEESDLLANPEDPKDISIRDPSVAGKTTKMLIRARKPE